MYCCLRIQQWTIWWHISNTLVNLEIQPNKRLFLTSNIRPTVARNSQIWDRAWIQINYTHTHTQAGRQAGSHRKKKCISASNRAVINSAVRLSSWAARHRIDRAAPTESDFLLRLLCCEIRFTVSSRKLPPSSRPPSSCLRLPFLFHVY